MAGVLQKAGQRPTPDLKCKLNISSFLTLPHLLDCLIPAMPPPFIVITNDKGTG